MAKGKLKAQTSPCEADAFILAVPTPVHEDEGHTPGLEYVDAAAQSIAPFVKGGNMVILESTSPVGTTERISDNLAKRGVDVSKVFFAHCPERVIPGRALIELVGNDRIIGGVTPEATKAVKALYATFVFVDQFVCFLVEVEAVVLEKSENVLLWYLCFNHNFFPAI